MIRNTSNDQKKIEKCATWVRGTTLENKMRDLYKIVWLYMKEAHRFRGYMYFKSDNFRFFL